MLKTQKLGTDNKFDHFKKYFWNVSNKFDDVGVSPKNFDAIGGQFNETIVLESKCLKEFHWLID